MPIQDFNIYTQNGYAGDLVDSGPRVVQTGILTTPGGAGFGLALKRDISIDRGVALGVEGTSPQPVFAISQRELNHEAGTRPAKKDVDGTWKYSEGGSVSYIRQGYLYVKLTGATGVKAGFVMNVKTTTGEFTRDSIGGPVIATTNVFAEEDGIPGDVIKVRIDIRNAY